MDKIGKYEIIDKIGEGGFGVVYKGKDPFIKRLVAVKTCSSENEAIQQRFFREAEIAGNLHHANVVTIHDFGVEEGTPYLVQEFLTGDDLDVVIKDTPERLTLAVKVRYLKGIAEGLNYAHAQGVIHRDIKPANIRILDNQRVKVMDFGIAKLKDQESQLTQTGMTLGTVAYLSPEQLRGQDVDYRADIFSYGILAYELVSGHRPFRADTIHSLFYQLLNDPAENLHELDQAVPEGLNEVVQTCLAKNPDDRYASFSEVISKLDEVQAEFGDSEDAQSSDVFMPRAPMGSGTTGTSLLAAKARNALDAGDLTAAELTINMARRDYSSEEDFQQHFADLEAELENRKSARDNEISEPSGPSLQDADTLERPPADGKTRDEGTQAVRVRVEALLAEGNINEAEREVSSAIAQYGPHTALSDLSRKIRESSNAAVATPGGDAATMHIDQATVDAAGAKAQAESPAPTAQPVATSASVATPVAASKSAPKLPIPLIAAAVVALLVVGFLAISLLGGDDEPTTEIAESDMPVNVEGAGSGATAGFRAGGAEGLSAVESDEQESGAAEAAPQPEATDPDPATAAPARTEPVAPTPAEEASGGTTQEASEPEASTDRDRRPDRPTELQTRELPSRNTPTSRPSRQPTSNSTRSNAPQQQTAPAAAPTRPAPEAQPREAEPEPSAADDFDPKAMQDKRAVRSVIDAYIAGWKSRDHDTVNRVYPGAGLKRADMRKYRQVDVTVGDCDIQLSGASATALCPITKSMTPRKGDPETVRLRGLELTKSGSDWRIARELR
ncbi:MAG: protein kinase [Acidobacteriota bacterium]